ncbi:GNAT family N-acetyltransferase [Roseibium sp.]|uniref:GNAT family N-acetyltransferase n=1 Tax=Roseibium sp. TaxID=1936156 RepID=UPI003A96C6F9
MNSITLETARLVLRPWQASDLVPFAEMNADPQVMRYFPMTLSTAESDALVARAEDKAKRDGVCFQPVALKETGEFLGFVGLSNPAYNPALPFMPCMEVGWRLKHSAWGHGYATEAARAWIGFGFETLALEEIVSFTARLNLPSRRVMQRCGMSCDAVDDFRMPGLDHTHPLSAHVLYRLRRAECPTVI